VTVSSSLLLPALAPPGGLTRRRLARLLERLSDLVSPASTGTQAPSGTGFFARDRVASDLARRFRERMLPHLDAAHNLARYLCRDADAAQDIVQDAFLRAFRSFATYRGDGDRAWLLAIVRNCHLDWRARAAKTERSETPFDDTLEDEHADLAPVEETPETSLLRRDEAARVRRQLETMPEAYREILVLRELEELSYREIADVTGLPIGTVMSRLARARALFQRAWTLSETGGRAAS
jgi:RNA polymerase sigma factor (sigma-70 family)